MTRTSEQIRDEVEERFGFFPPFFEPALPFPQILENLWQQTLTAYIQNPLSELFKEKLNALLSRYCVVPYCMIVHSAALRPLGMTAREVLAMLDADQDIAALPSLIAAPSQTEAASPPPGSPLEETLLVRATAVFLEQDAEENCSELRRLLGPDLYPHLITYLAYIKTCHVWIEAHLEISYEADARAVNNLGPMLEEEPALAEFFHHYKEKVSQQRLGRRAEQAISAERQRADVAIRRADQRASLILESIPDAFFALDKEWCFIYLNGPAERLLSRPREELLGKCLWEEFPAAVGTASFHEHHRAIDTQTTVTFEEYYPPPLDCWFEVCASPSPDGLSVYFHNISPRRAMEQERERHLAEAEARGEREALLNGIGQAIRSTTDPESIQATVASLLGAALGADRCYFSMYDAQADAVRIAQDWHRQDLPSVAGEYGLSAYQDYVDALYADGTAIISDAHDPAVAPAVRQVLAGFGIRAFLAVPLFDNGKFVAAIAASMNDAPRVWTADEISLMESVQTQTRMAAEAARVIQREKIISQQLQAALQPDLPGTVPGLKLTKYYKPALAEAGVGGDFYDVFAVEKGCTALVVGDLSGKGLAAAAQVATVRNMLRAFLYSKPTVVEAVLDLNRILAENSLLSSFATLFIGAYDSGTQTLKYVNCGQEAALVRRAGTGIVEHLFSTGPILGATEAAQYVEATVTLSAGDALAIFTDGLTEVGPTRTAMLDIEGVTALFSQPICAGESRNSAEMAEYLTQHLISGVDAAAQGGVMRDDMCLLMAVVDCG